MARTHKQNAFAKMDIRADFEKKHCTDEIRGYIDRYRELKRLISKEEKFSTEHTILSRKKNQLEACIGNCWLMSYLEKNPDKNAQDYVDLKNTWMLTVKEEMAIDTTNGAFVQC